MILFLFAAKPGMGKTCSMAMMAMKWVDGDIEGTVNKVLLLGTLN